MTTVAEQFQIYINQISTRKRSPVKQSTLDRYQSYWRTWIQPNIGYMDIAAVENGTMKKLVSTMARQGLGASAIFGVTNCVKGIVSSVMDDNGNELLARTWNAEFIDAPIDDPKARKTPAIDGKGVFKAISKVQASGSQYPALLALLGATGARISEILGIKVGICPKLSYWDPKESKLVIRSQFYKGVAQSPKTPSGIREIDLPKEMNDYLELFCTEEGRKNGDFMFQAENRKALSPQTAYSIIYRHDILPFHSFRRFRITHLENVGVPGGLARFWTGHSSRDVHDSYIKLDRQIEARKEWCEKAGLGFKLPQTLSEPLAKSDAYLEALA